MMMASDDRHAWDAFGLEEVRGIEDLDASVEAALDSPLGEMRDAPRRLAEAFGFDEAGLERRMGVPIAPEVAAARLTLISAALARCRTLAEMTPAHAALRHAVAVCAALQHEALGEPLKSEMVLARRADEGVSLDAVANALRLSADGERIGLAVVRELAAAGRDDDLECRLTCAALPMSDALPLPCGTAGEAVSARAVLGALTDILAMADEPGRTVRSGETSGSWADAAAHALATRGASAFAASDFVSDRLSVHLGAMGGEFVIPCTDILSGPVDAAGRAAWRAVAARPEFRVIAPLIFAPAHLAWRIGGEPETGTLAVPLRSALRRGGAARGAALRDMRAASTVLAVLCGLADAGMITGRLPDEPHARAIFSAAGRVEDSICRGSTVLRFDRGGAFGALLGLAADTATLLAYRRGLGAPPTGAVPLDWLLAPPGDDVPLDLAVAAMVCAIPLLAPRVIRGLAPLVRFLTRPEGEVPPPHLDLGPRVEPRPAAWADLFGRLWDATAGLSASVSARVNLWGEPVGRPDGGVSAWAGPEYDAAGGLSAAGRLLLDLGAPVELPTRGAEEDETLYWGRAARVGGFFRTAVDAVLRKGHPLAPAFSGGCDPGVRRLILCRLAAQAETAARRDTLLTASEGLLRLA